MNVLILYSFIASFHIRLFIARLRKKYLELYTVNEKTSETNPFSPFIEIDNETVKFDEQFDGMNVIVTSELKMSDEKIFDQYKEPSKIEDCFKITKTQFNTRPVFV